QASKSCGRSLGSLAPAGSGRESWPLIFTSTPHRATISSCRTTSGKKLLSSISLPPGGPCREEMPEMERYLQAHKNEPFLLLAIDAEEKKEQVNGFFQELKLAFPVGIDEGPIRKAYGVTAFPTTILIGVDGKVQFYEAGALANADVAFDSFLRMNREMLKSGHAISKDSYLAQLGQAARETAATGHDDVFDGRAKRIAARMDCPCGCDKRVGACQCHTARGVRKALDSGGCGNAPDAEIIKRLNKTFCIGQARRDAS